MYLSFEGYLFEWFFTTKPRYNVYSAIHSHITIIFVLLFAKYFLKKQFTPQLDTGTRIFIGVCIILIICNLLIPEYFIIHNNLSQLLSVLSMLYILLVAIINVFKKNLNAIYFLISWLVFIVGGGDFDVEVKPYITLQFFYR